MRLVTGASANLVTPLIDSLRHEMVVTDTTLLDRYALATRALDDNLREAVQSQALGRVPKRAMGTVLEFSEDVAQSFRIDCRDEAGQVATADRGRPKCVS